MSKPETVPVRTSARPWPRRVARAGGVYVLTPYLVVTLIFACLQRQFLYPSTRVDRPLRAADSFGGDQADDVKLTTTDGLTLHGWLVHTRGEVATSQGRLLVLFFSGNGGNRSDRILDCREFAALGCDVLLFDYRGYGENPGTPGESALADDARQAWIYATGDLGVPPDRIVVFGESLGGAVAVRLAAESCRAGTPPAGLVLNSTFASLPETVHWHYPAFPFQFLLLDRYPSVDLMPQVTCPILQYHGTDDEFVPLAHGRRLFEAAPEQSRDGVSRQFVTIEHGTHNALPVSLVEEELALFVTRIRTSNRQ